MKQADQIKEKVKQYEADLLEFARELLKIKSYTFQEEEAVKRVIQETNTGRLCRSRMGNRADLLCRRRFCCIKKDRIYPRGYLRIVPEGVRKRNHYYSHINDYLCSN